jgi:cytochrome P450
MEGLEGEPVTYQDVAMTIESAAPTALPDDFLIPPAPVPPRVPPSSRDMLGLYRRNALLSWTERDYEAEWGRRRLFGRAAVLLSMPAGIRHVLLDNADNYTRTRPSIRILRPLLGESGLFLAEGDDWRHQRRVLAPAFAPRAVPVFARVTATVLQEVLPVLAEDPETPVDLLDRVQLLTLDVAVRAMFSLPIGDSAAGMRRMIRQYGEVLAQPNIFDFVLPLSLPGPRDLARLWFKRRWMRLIGHLVAQRQKEGQGESLRDLFDVIVAARHPETGEPFDTKAIRDQVATLVVAGHETTAVTLFWALYLLALAPTWQMRVAEEAQALDLSPDGAAESLPKLVLARAVVEEALRLYPPAFLLVRMAKGADCIGPVMIEPGTIVTIAPWILHRHRRLWENPEVFDPTRFLRGAKPVDRFVYMPFGAGPRICIGAPLALAEATLVLASFAKAFRVEAPGPPAMPLAVITTQPDRPVRFFLHPR